MFAMTIFGHVLSAALLTVLFFVWILIALLPASIAKSKGRSFWLFFFISIFFWWITLFVTLFMKGDAGPARPAAPTPPTTPPAAG